MKSYWFQTQFDESSSESRCYVHILYIYDTKPRDVVIFFTELSFRILCVYVINNNIKTEIVINILFPEIKSLWNKQFEYQWKPNYYVQIKMIQKCLWKYKMPYVSLRIANRFFKTVLKSVSNSLKKENRISMIQM